MPDTVTGRIRHAERLTVSRSGNPRFRLTVETDEGPTRYFTTQTDASVNWDVENYLPTGRRLLFTLSRAGRITDITYDDGSRR